MKKMKNGAILRFITVCICCTVILIYNFLALFDNFKINSEENLKTDITPQEKEIEIIEKEVNYEIKKETQPKQNETEKREETASVAVSAEAIKGKILTKYISPYNAPLSYDKVYMKNNTDLKIDIKTLLKDKINFKIEKNNSPQVLILHTHATESFFIQNTDYYTEKYNSRSKNNENNMIAVGAVVAQKLNESGIKTLHDKTLHDYPNYTGSYSRSAKTVKSYLKKYPSIKVVLDLHRDAVTAENSDKVKLVTKINQKNAAQVMLVMGSQSGSIKDFPKWRENLKLALRVQQGLEKKYPTLARPLILNSKKYNQNLTTGSLLLEFGTDANSLDEAIYSAELVGNVLAELLGNI